MNPVQHWTSTKINSSSQNLCPPPAADRSEQRGGRAQWEGKQNRAVHWPSSLWPGCERWCHHCQTEPIHLQPLEGTEGKQRRTWTWAERELTVLCCDETKAHFSFYFIFKLSLCTWETKLRAWTLGSVNMFCVCLDFTNKHSAHSPPEAETPHY